MAPKEVSTLFGRPIPIVHEADDDDDLMDIEMTSSTFDKRADGPTLFKSRGDSSTLFKARGDSPSGLNTSPSLKSSSLKEAMGDSPNSSAFKTISTAYDLLATPRNDDEWLKDTQP